jgi:hypothetical protein
MDVPGIELVSGGICCLVVVLMFAAAALAEYLRPPREERYVETRWWCVVGQGEGGKDPGWRVQKIKYINDQPQVPKGDLVIFRADSYSSATDCLARTLAKERASQERRRKPR